MAFRRRFRRGFRRRRPGPETYSLAFCRGQQNIWQVGATCTNPMVQMDTIVTPALAVGISDPTTAGAVVAQKAIRIEGIKFSSEYLYDPGNDIGDPSCDGFQPLQAAFVLTIWEALVVLPLTQGSKTLPFYLPTFTTSVQNFDVADRVLWKRITQMPLWGLNTTGGIPQLMHTVRDAGHGPIAVKTRCRIDDRHGLFYARQFVHDQFIPENTLCQKLIQWDTWYKVFYRVSR